MNEVNNSGKNAKWLKSKNQHDKYTCSLCGEINWYNSNKTLEQSDFCPNCGARMTHYNSFIDINDAIEYCQNACDDSPMSINQYSIIKMWLKDLLKRQLLDEPKNVINAMYSGNSLGGTCPECGFYLSNNENPIYCGKCGQKLKWD